MKRIIINADDFGYCEAVNYGIIECYKQGIVSSTTIMANMPGFDHAVDLIKKYPKLGLGIHLTLTCNKPIGSGYKTLTDEYGNFFKEDNNFDEEEVFQEWCLQMEKCLSAGLNIDHIDSHHHLHMKENYANVLQRFVKTYPLPVRGEFGSMLSVKQTTLFGKFYKYNCTIDYLQDFLSHMKEDKIYDIMCHPAYMDTYLQNATSYATGRLVEYDVLTSKEMHTFMKENQIQLITYPEL